MTSKCNSEERITLDFDGVIHAYTTPWERADIIPDGIIPGSIEWLLEAFKRGYNVAILSARSSQPGGIIAMQQWLQKHLKYWISNHQGTNNNPIKVINQKYILADFNPESDDLDYEKYLWSVNIINKILWPVSKLPSKIYIDDNAYRFKGKWPSFDDIDGLESWVK